MTTNRIPIEDTSNFRYIATLILPSVRSEIYTFFKTLCKINFQLKVYTLENTLLNLSVIISKIRNFMNNFAKKLNFLDIFYYVKF